MNAKLVLALIVALQVSTCLCEMPVPDKELVDKYEEYKATFYKRLLGAYKKIQGAVVPMAEGMEHGQIVKQYAEVVKVDPRMQSAIKIATGVAGELAPAVDKARQAALGLYGEYLRPYIGQPLDQAIQNIKPILDAIMPAEE